jgi:hypothetical protein
MEDVTRPEPGGENAEAAGREIGEADATHARKTTNSIEADNATAIEGQTGGIVADIAAATEKATSYRVQSWIVKSDSIEADIATAIEGQTGGIVAHKAAATEKATSYRVQSWIVKYGSSGALTVANSADSEWGSFSEKANSYSMIKSWVVQELKADAKQDADGYFVPTLLNCERMLGKIVNKDEMMLQYSTTVIVNNRRADFNKRLVGHESARQFYKTAREPRNCFSTNVRFIIVNIGLKTDDASLLPSQLWRPPG